MSRRFSLLGFHPWSGDMAACLALGMLALVVRCFVACRTGVFVDEAYVWYLSRGSLYSVVAAARPDLNTPFFSLLIHLIPGTQPQTWVLRLPSVLGGALAVMGTAWWALRLGGRGVALRAGSLLTLSYACVLSDAQIRPYGLLAAMFAVLLWVALEEEVPVATWRWVAYALAALVATLLHYLGLAVVGMLVVAAALGPHRRRVLLASMPALALGGLWLVYSWTGPVHADLRGRMAHGGGVLPFDWLHTPAYLLGLAVPLQWPACATALGIASPLAHQTATFLVDALMWGCIVRGGWRVARKSPHQARILLTMTLLPLLLLAVGARLGVQPYQHRYAVSLAGPWMVLVCLGWNSPGVRAAEDDGREPSGKSPRACLEPGAASGSPSPGVRLLAPVQTGLECAWLVAATVLVVLTCTWSFLWNQDWVGVSQFVHSHERPGDVAVLYVPYSTLGFEYAYAPATMKVQFSPSCAVALEPGPNYRGVDPRPVVPAALTPGYAASLSGRRVFLILNQEAPAAGTEIRHWFGERFEVVDALRVESLHSWGNIEVYYLQARP